MKIAFDLDDVLNNLSTKWEEWIVRHDPEFRMEHVLSWEISEYTTMKHDVFDFLHLPKVFTHLAVVPDAQSVLKQLHDAGHELFVISSLKSNPECWYDKVEWIKGYFPFIKHENIIASSRKGLMKVDVLVDDGLHNFEDFEGHAIVIGKPWNRYDYEDQLHPHTTGFGDLRVLATLKILQSH